MPCSGSVSGVRPDHLGEPLGDDRSGAVVRARQHVGVNAQREDRVAMAEVFGKFLDGDTSSEHDAGVVVTEPVDEPGYVPTRARCLAPAVPSLTVFLVP